jgi:hypothetical protein
MLPADSYRQLRVSDKKTIFLPATHRNWRFFAWRRLMHCPVIVCHGPLSLFKRRRCDGVRWNYWSPKPFRRAIGWWSCLERLPGETHSNKFSSNGEAIADVPHTLCALDLQRSRELVISICCERMAKNFYRHRTSTSSNSTKANPRDRFVTRSRTKRMSRTPSKRANTTWSYKEKKSQP